MVKISALVSFPLVVSTLLVAPSISHADIQAVSCLVGPSRSAVLSSGVPGLLETINVQRGEEVERDQVLFSLNSDVEEASLALESARVAFAQRTLQRNQRLIERGILSESERDEMDTELSMARLQAGLAEARIADRMIQAPFPGIIASLDSEEGEYIDNTPVMQLVQMDPLELELVLPLNAFGRFSVGEVLDVELIEPIGEIMPAEITSIDRFIDPSSGTFVIYLTLDNAENTIPPGINCRLPNGW
ncbi:efflux RND transporter periplasmic adaptor subunit [Halomonas sp. GFAJ-1]|uniref:efflux RND transporter periplasmic adaptor subunit n=1 Tax=Halomonas sp. GFAJ-1 TaxID=1118153 RepID=UPI00023A4699|nr:efflux RND transporter periplasmic adaptor subunit [Halomonas sp. GFAJ-1]AVI62951.1 efflux transporter periplasmic adaptor subunit [Halomonas sp. GFAJ-1]EHK61985.1 hemolysin D [Halomonas sp. GFAJ-1]